MPRGQIDLAEVRALVLLHETGSVTATAELMHVTQPTVSYTLAKLRRRFGEELFVRGPNGLEPTPTARELYGPFRASLRGIDDAVAGPTVFEPTTTTRGFTLMLSDYGELSFLPLLVPRLAEVAPRASLRVRPLDVHTASDLLVRGQVDVVVTSVDLGVGQLDRRLLMVVDYVVLVAEDHPRLGGSGLTREAFAAERLVSVQGPAGHLAPVRLVQRLGLGDRVELVLTNFGAVPYVVAAGDLLAVVPRHIAEVYAARHRVRALDLPWPVDPIEVAAWGRPRPDLAGRWFTDLVDRTLSSDRFS